MERFNFKSGCAVRVSKLIYHMTRQMLQHRGGKPSTNYSEFEMHACMFVLQKVIKQLINWLSGFGFNNSQWQNQ